MADLVTIKLTGFSDLEKKLREFGPNVEKAGQRQATAAGAKIAVDAAKAAESSHTKTGLLQRNIRAFRRRSTQPGTIIYGIGVRRADKAKRYANNPRNKALGRAKKKYLQDGPAFYGRFLEMGSSKQPARPWLRPSFIGNIDNMIDRIRDVLSKAIDRAAAKR